MTARDLAVGELKFRDPARARALSDTLAHVVDEIGRTPVSVMHVCGSHEQAIARFGLRATLPKTLDVIMGPGCPVCITDVPEVDEGVVDQAAERVVEPPPHQVDDERRHRPRQQQERAEEVAAPDPLIQHERHGHAEDELQGHGRDREHDRVHDRGGELRPRQHVGEVAEAHELTGRADRLVREGQPDRVEEWIQDEPDQDQDGRREQRHAAERLARARGRPARRARRRRKSDGDGPMPDGHGAALRRTSRRSWSRRRRLRRRPCRGSSCPRRDAGASARSSCS